MTLSPRAHSAKRESESPRGLYRRSRAPVDIIIVWITREKPREQDRECKLHAKRGGIGFLFVMRSPRRRTRFPFITNDTSRVHGLAIKSRMATAREGSITEIKFSTRQL